VSPEVINIAINGQQHQAQQQQPNSGRTRERSGSGGGSSGGIRHSTSATDLRSQLQAAAHVGEFTVAGQRRDNSLAVPLNKSQQAASDFANSVAASSATTYGNPLALGNALGVPTGRTASNSVGGSGSSHSTPNWGPPVYPPPKLLEPVESKPRSLASLYQKLSSPSPAIVFTPSPRPPQNLPDDPAFFEVQTQMALCSRGLQLWVRRSAQ
jgi:hypothetical protein